MATVFDCVRCGGVYDTRAAFCVFCGAFDAVLPRAVRPSDQAWACDAEVLGAGDLVKRSVTKFTSRSYPDLKIGPESLVSVYGPPGGGKSIFLLKFLDGVSGPVLYVSIEEGMSDTLTEKLRWLEIVRDDFSVTSVSNVGGLGSAVDSVRPGAIAVDSLTKSTLLVDDLKRLVRHARVPVLFSLHVTKDGSPAGPNTIIHDVDVSIEIGERFWAVQKSRFCGQVSGEV